MNRGAGKRQVKVPQQPLLNIPSFGAEDEDSDFQVSEEEIQDGSSGILEQPSNALQGFVYSLTEF